MENINSKNPSSWVFPLWIPVQSKLQTNSHHGFVSPEFYTEFLHTNKLFYLQRRAHLLILPTFSDFKKQQTLRQPNSWFWFWRIHFLMLLLGCNKILKTLRQLEFDGLAEISFIVKASPNRTGKKEACIHLK